MLGVVTSASDADDQPDDVPVGDRPVLKVGEIRPGPANMDWPAHEPGADEDV